AEEASRAWREAADAAPDPEGRAECLYQGALMREALSGGAKRAIGWLREALGENPEHTGALRRLADHGLASESWQDAKSWLETLCRLREDPRDHADLGRVLWEGFGEEQRALASLRAAMALPEAGLDAVNLAVTICAERENWPRLAAVVEEFLSEKELSPAHIPLLEQLADVTAEKLYETEKAARALRAVVELAPGDLDARRALAAILARDQETHAEAIGEYRRIIAASPLDALAWRGLAELNWFAKRRAGCEIAAAVVRITGGGADAAWEGVSGERGTAVAIESAVALCAPGSAARSALGEPALLDPLKRALQNAWPRLVPAAQGSPASTAQWPGARASALEQALGFWGIPGTPVFMAGEEGAPLRVTGGPRVAIGVREESMRKLPESIWRFYCHRVAAQIALGHGPAAVLDAAALGALLDALRGAANGAANGERVGDVVNWRNRRKIKAALDQLGNPGPEDLAACIAGFSESADRAALIACGDPAAALAGTALLGMEAPGFDPDRDPMAPLLDRSPAARRLLVFAAGEPFLEAIAQAAP
ncbi:MAG: tetratricopeptide repeat protein, partial [Myxococcota bacterium]